MAKTIDLSEQQWNVIQPLLSPPNRLGRPRADDRRTLNGILYILRTGCRWQDLPKVYGSPITCFRRLHRWVQDGTWERIWQALLQTLDEDGKRKWARAFLDGSFVPVKKGTRL